MCTAAEILLQLLQKIGTTNMRLDERRSGEEEA
jgi:hypothetical protein